MTTTGRPARHSAQPATAHGPVGNERLTAWAGSVLLVLLALEGLTILLSVERYLLVHVVVGAVLVGPLALKVASTGYRFVRYYTGDPAYRKAGPPQLLLRVLAPFLVVLTVAVLLTGVVLLVVPEQDRGLLLLAHKASFVLWIGLAAVHVLAYVWRVPRLVGADVGLDVPAPGRAAEHPVGSLPGARPVWTRLGALALSVAAGAGLAALLLPDVSVWTNG